MLYLIGMGLKPRDLSLRAIAAIQKADAAYAETYTNPFDMETVEKIVGRKIEMLEREKVESDFLVEQAKKKNVVLLVPGDPLSATTHVQLLIDAKKAGIEANVVHNSSVMTAVAACGLSLYKFGRTTTMPAIDAESVYDAIKNNQKMGLHTLLLLDIGMEPKKALERLEKRFNGKMFVCWALGTEKQKIRYAKPVELMKESGKMPACIVVPGKIDHNEEGAIRALDWEAD